MNENNYSKKLILLRITCISLIAFCITIWMHNYYHKDDFYIENYDYIINKEKIHLEVEHLDIYENDNDEYISDKGEYSEISLANKYNHFMRGLNYDYVNVSSFLKSNYSNPKVINNIDEFKKIMSDFRNNGMNWNPKDDYNNDYFKKGSLIVYYYEGENTYITDAFSLAEKIDQSAIRIKMDSLEGKLNETYKNSNAMVVFIEIAHMADESKIEMTVNKIKPNTISNGFASYYQLND